MTSRSVMPRLPVSRRRMKRSIANSARYITLPRTMISSAGVVGMNSAAQSMSAMAIRLRSALLRERANAFGDERRSAIDESRVELDQRCARVDPLARIVGRQDAARGDDGQRAVERRDERSQS